MHLPSVSSELANQVRRQGAIDQEEFSKLILHWFPAAWSLMFTLERQLRSVSVKASREEDDTVPIRLLRSLVHMEAPSKSKPPPAMVPSKPQRVIVPDRVGDKGVAEVHALLAGDAMRRCAEARFHFRLILEDPETLLVIPGGAKPPPVDLPAISMIEERFPRACDQVHRVVADLRSHRNAIGKAEASRSASDRSELTTLMAMHAYRLRLEREYGIQLVYQWPGVIACAGAGKEKNLESFRSAAEQVLAIHGASS
jgi:hypothetical protein